MRTILLTGLLTLTALAGCIDGDGTDAGPGDGFGQVDGPYALDCSISNWDEPCLVLASPNDSPSKTEIDLVVNPTDPSNVVVASKDKDPLATNDCVWSVAQFTKDGGHTWTTSYVGGTIADREPGDLLYGYDCVTDPIMTFNKDGTLFYNLQAYRLDNEPDNPAGLPGPDAALMALAISPDGGETWPTIIQEQVGDDLTVFPDYMHMGANPQTGTIFAVWNNIGALTTSNPTMIRYAGGETTDPPKVFPTPESATGFGASSIVGANDGTMYFCICSFNSGGETWWTTSVDDGQTWETPTLRWEWVPMGSVDNVEFRTGTTVETAIDNSGGEFDGCIHATWNGQDATAGGDPADIYVRRTCDGGETWTDIVAVNPATAGGAQLMPRIAVDGHGGVHIVYLTQHYDGERQQWLDAEWAHSTDGGATWTTTRLTNITFDGDLGIHQNGFPFLGDYIGIGAVGDHVYMAFPTTHTGRAEIAVAHAQYVGA